MLTDEEFKQIEMIKELRQSQFAPRLNHIWEVAQKDIHPFQKGDSHQASEHTFNIIRNLSELIKASKNYPHSQLEKYLLYCSAILHDIDKATIDYERNVSGQRLHGIRSAEFIRDNRSIFGFTKPEAEAVAIIVEHHGDKSLEQISTYYPPEKIDNPKFYSKYSPINYANLSSFFRLADMMDITYKRVSEPIIKLNFPDGRVDSKITARQLMKKCVVSFPYIKLTTYEIKTTFAYQAILIAIDMINKELIDTGTKNLLQSFGYPYMFCLDTMPIDDRIRPFKEARKEISNFNKEFQLTICEKSEGELIKIYNQFKHEFEFSHSEMNELKTKAPYIYSNSTKRPIDEISNELRSLFGYSIKRENIIRRYREDGSLECFIEYLGIAKPKELSFAISYEITEHSVLAVFDEDCCDITEYPDEQNPGFIHRVDTSDKARIKLVWPETAGYDYIDKMAGRFVVRNAWCKSLADFDKFYPDDPEVNENFRTDIKYPICKIKIALQFPIGYEVEPRCLYKFKSKFENLELQYDVNKNIYTLENLHNEGITLRNYPKYNISWAIPD